MTEESHVISWSNKLLDYLLKQREQKPDFKFWLRQRDRGDRLSNGYWFQGNDNYIFLSFWARSGGTNMTRSLGWVIGINEDGTTPTHMEVVYNGETDSEIIGLYQSIINHFGMKMQTKTKYRLDFTETDPFKSLAYYLQEVKPVIDDIIRKSGKEEMFISDGKFDEMLNNTLALRTAPATQDTQQSTTREENSNRMETALNQILFGPPGTGKTYHTINEAIKIVDPEFYKTHQHDRGKLKVRFRELLIKDWETPNGQIAFCTFHQSFSYEDFVEGIKPLKPTEDDKYLKYVVEDGIFKRICRLSEDSRTSKKIKTERILSWNEETLEKASFYKISLGNSNKPEDQEIFDYCIKNNCIALGYGGMNDFTGMDEEEIKRKSKELEQSDFTAQVLNYFIHYLKKDNYVLASYGNNYVRALGKVTGDYEYKPDAGIRFNHFRPVEWLFFDQIIPIDNIYDRKLSQSTIYKLDSSGIKKDFFVATGHQTKAEDKTDKKFVLIIDEVNRGNVSSIFGELITLIEKDKRADGDEQLEVTLPYSKEPFKVPDNVYLIGTMNTADRSIEALDTALRRRFSFREMPSNPGLIKSEGSLKPTGKIGEIDVVILLRKINERIGKLIDKDHMIGHSYFMDIKNEDDLKCAFRDKVIPLLEEYFFGDFGKIGLVLGTSFVEKVEGEFEFAKFDAYDEGITTDLKERAVFKIRDEAQWNFVSIYE